MRRTGFAILVVVAAACGSGDGSDVSEPLPSSTTSTTDAATSADDSRRIEVVVTGGRPAGGARTESVALGEQVVLTITSDTSDEVHVHGYDLSAPVAPGAPAVLTFQADKPGGWEVELHDAGSLLLELQVG